MKAIIVEDEQSAVNNLMAALDRVKPGINIIGKFKSVTAAIKGIKELLPDLVFLDVHLDGEMTGLDLLERTAGYDYKVIFTTSYKEHAVAAFEYNAVHFLLKPYSDDKLNEAIERVEQISIKDQQQHIEELKTTDKFINKHSDYQGFRKNNGDYTIRNFLDCIYLEADGAYVSIYFSDGTEEGSSNKSLTEYENILKFRDFIRISQKHLINLRFIKKYIKPSKHATAENIPEKQKQEGAGGSVVLKNDVRLPVSRQCCQSVKEALNIS